MTKSMNSLGSLPINHWKNIDLYNDSSFVTIHNIISTHHDGQKIFNLVVAHQFDDDPLEVESNILSSALFTLGQKNVRDLMKLSAMTYWLDKYNERESQKILEFTGRAKGQWYFFPDVRTEIEDCFCESNPVLACEVKPFPEYEVPEDHHLNRWKTNSLEEDT